MGSVESKRELLVKVTAKDCRWDFYVGSGKGGQAKQKTNSACRCTHVASGAVGESQDDRSQDLNKRKAFERMAKTDKFNAWLKMEVSRVTGEAALIKEKVNRELLLNTVVETQNEAGKWEENKELEISHWDIRNFDE